MTQVTIYDGINYFRRRLEKASFGENVPRLIFHETFLDPTHQRIFVWDGGHHNERRRVIYPAYKSKRPPASEPVRQGLEFFQELMSRSAATQIRVPTYEADDVIAALVFGYRQRGLEVNVESNDWDLKATGAIIRAVPSCPIKASVPWQHIHLFKTLCGDSSDSISGIPGFGPKTWSELPDHERLLAAFVLQDLEAILAFPWPKARGVRKWVEANPETLLAMWDITGFLEVPEAELVLGIKAGTRDRQAGEAMMQEFFL